MLLDFRISNIQIPSPSIHLYAETSVPTRQDLMSVWAMIKIPLLFSTLSLFFFFVQNSSTFCWPVWTGLYLSYKCVPVLVLLSPSSPTLDQREVPHSWDSPSRDIFLNLHSLTHLYVHVSTNYVDTYEKKDSEKAELISKSSKADLIFKTPTQRNLALLRCTKKLYKMKRKKKILKPNVKPRQQSLSNQFFYFNFWKSVAGNVSSMR